MVVGFAKILRSLGIGIEKDNGTLYSDEQLPEFDNT